MWVITVFLASLRVDRNSFWCSAIIRKEVFEASERIYTVFMNSTLIDILTASFYSFNFGYLFILYSSLLPYKHINQFSLLSRVNVLCFTVLGDETYSLNIPTSYFPQKIIEYYDRDKRVRPTKGFGFGLRMYKILCEWKNLRFRWNLCLRFFRGHARPWGETIILRCERWDRVIQRKEAHL